ncbi:MAG: hypothetical protein IKO56_10765 [Alphaproteobacteria bacterium]|nr:hypothetical protein [Alphaproteobacteria bacterium]
MTLSEMIPNFLANPLQDSETISYTIDDNSFYNIHYCFNATLDDGRVVGTEGKFNYKPNDYVFRIASEPVYEFEEHERVKAMMFVNSKNQEFNNSKIKLDIYHNYIVCVIEEPLWDGFSATLAEGFSELIPKEKRMDCYYRQKDMKQAIFNLYLHCSSCMQDLCIFVNKIKDNIHLNNTSE